MSSPWMRPANHRYDDLVPLPGMTGALAEMALYAGQSVNLVHDVFPAGLLIQDMAAQAVTTIDLLHSSAMR
jgi:nitronate monooxygenase/enoyl-[acyl-carrier protein] reductase II